MPILVDGNNLLHRLPLGERSRAAVRRLVLERTRGQRQRITVVFDGPPPPEAPAVEPLGPVTIRYAGSRAADDVIIAALPEGPPARQWVVVTDDRELGRRARELGAEVRSLESWRAAAVRPPAVARALPERSLSKDELAEWESVFSTSSNDRPAEGVAVRRRRRPR